MKTTLIVPLIASLAMAQHGAADSRPIILAFGDSLTFGYGAPAGAVIRNSCKSGWTLPGISTTSLNMGVRGDATGSARARMSRALRFEPATVILVSGIVMKAIEPLLTR